MTDRDRLIELLKQATTEVTFRTSGGRPVTTIQRSIVDFAEAKDLADHLIANGVIVPPCKVGDTVWHKEEGYLLDSYKIKFIYNDMTASNISRDLLFCVEDIGKTIFLTKEEAEEKLKELGK